MQNIARNARNRWKKRIDYNLWIIWSIVFSIFAIDLFIKNYLRNSHPYQSFPVIKNVFNITVVFNKGAALGILQGKTSFLIYVSIIFIIIFFFTIRKEKNKSRLFLISSGLVIGGALSNLYDRVTLGYVIDYLDIRIWVFNLSDAAITIGIGMMFLDSLRKNKSKDESSAGC